LLPELETREHLFPEDLTRQKTKTGSGPIPGADFACGLPLEKESRQTRQGLTAKFKNRTRKIMRTTSKNQEASLPHDTIAEAAVLGACLLDERVFDRINFLKADEFYDRGHRKFYEIMATMIGAGKLASHITMREHVAGIDGIDDVKAFFENLAAEAATILTAPQYAQMVRDLAVRRKLIAIADKMLETAYGADPDVRPADLIERSERELLDLQSFDFRDHLKREFVLLDKLDDDTSKEWLVKDWLGIGDASVIYGKPGDGKSVLTEDMALHIAEGRPWFGRKVKQGAVVYVALERKKLVERRAIAYRLKNGTAGAPFAVVGGVHDLRDPATADHIVRIIGSVETDTKQKVVLIVIDTLARALCGGDENSSTDMGAIVNATSILQDRTSAHIQWVHHVPLSDGDRMRGHSSLLGAVDVTISVSRNSAVRTARIIKANDSEEGEQVAFTLESVVVGRDGDGDETTAPVVVPTVDEGMLAAMRAPITSKAAQIAMTALAEAIDEHGKPPASPCPEIPPRVKVVTVEQWRDQAYRRGISGGEDRAKQRAFKRALEYLVAARRVGFWSDLVWFAS
jgi:hypothetical protein